MMKVFAKSLVKAAGVAAAALIGSTAAQAADPMVVLLSPGYSFEAYTGSATVGIGAIDIDNTLFFIDEKTVGDAKSWLIFADTAARAQVSAVLQFDQPILAVYTTRADLDSSTPIYGLSTVSYGSKPLTGLEGNDSVEWTLGGTVLTIDWRVSDPGDHIRVLLAAPVPEPSPMLLLAGGLVALGWLKRRRPGSD